MTRRDRATVCPVLGDRSRLSGQFGYTRDLPNFNRRLLEAGRVGSERRSPIGQAGRRPGCQFGSGPALAKPCRTPWPARAIS